MKKLNNKGFAISTVIYGLSIMGILMLTIIMSLLSSSRANNKDVAKSIEEELIRFSKTSVVFGQLDGGQEFIVPEGEGGWYRIELWGAQGNKTSGGKGAYTTGVIRLTEGEHLYFYVGKNGNTGQGGGATDVRLVNSNASDGVNSRIMVAAGGGSGVGADGGTIVGYNKTMVATGGSIDRESNYEINSGETLVGYLTTGTSKYTTSSLKQDSKTPGIFGSNKVGGEGYITSEDANVGGISFISGYAGSCATIQGTLKDTPKYTHFDYTYKTGVTGEYETTGGKPYYFIDGMMIPGIKTGDGKAIVEKILSDEDFSSYPVKNTKLNGVRYIKDCLASGTENTQGTIIAISQGDKVNGTITPNNNCRTLDLGSAKNLDEVAVWHKAGVDPLNNTIQVSSDNANWKTIKGIVNLPETDGLEVNRSSPDVPETYTTPYSETETEAGIHISAYQPDFVDQSTPIDPNGNYYIMPVTALGKVISTYGSHDETGNDLFIDDLVGEGRQKWSIEKIEGGIATPGSNEYKIVELTKYNGLKIKNDENLENNNLIAQEFNSYARSEPSIWHVTKAGDGTVVISTVLKSAETGRLTGNVYAQTNSFDSLKGYVLIGYKNVKVTRFKLYKLDL